MRTRSIVLPDVLVRAALAGCVTELRVPMKPQPALWQTNDGPRWAWRMRNGTFHDVENDELRMVFSECPLGVAGDRLVVRESWGVGTRPDPFEGWYDGIEYRADEYGLDEHDLLPLHRVNVPDGVDLDAYRGRWHGATEMPLWASRLAFDVLGSRCEQASDMTEESAWAMGVEALDGWFDDAALAKRSVAMMACIEDPRVSAAELWDHIHGQQFPWSPTLWQWVAKVRRA